MQTFFLYFLNLSKKPIKEIIKVNWHRYLYAFTQTLHHKISFQAEYSWFEFRVFLLFDRLPNQD